MNKKRLLEGIVDLHIHAGPSVAQRAVDAGDVLIQAQEAGYKAIVIKDHFFPTMMGCKMVERHLGDGSTRVFGGLALNNSIGGFNLNALDAACGMGARIIWMPTLSSKRHIEQHKGQFIGAGNMTIPEKPIYYLNKDNELCDKVVSVLEFMSSYPEVVLATGHGNVKEINALIKKAFEVGVKKILVNHPHFLINASFENVKKWAEMGAFIEINAIMFEDISPASAGGQGLPIGLALEYINKLPSDKIIIDTDLGQKGGTLPIEGMYRFLTLLIEKGVSLDKIEMMAKINPSKLINI